MVGYQLLQNKRNSQLEINTFLPNNFHTWPTLLCFAILFSSFCSQVFVVVPNIGNWITYILFSLVVICFAIIPALNISKEEELQKGYTASSLLTSITFLFIAFSAIWKIVMTDYSGISVTRIVFTPLVLVLFSAIGFFSVSKIFIGILHCRMNLALPASILIMVSVLFTTTRYGIELGKQQSDLVPFICLGFIIGALLGLLVSHKSEITNPAKLFPSFFTFFSLIVLSGFLSFRVDQIFNIAGAKFHWSYFTGAIDTLRSGGTLLWDTPSQYGLGPILIPTLLPINNSTTAFLIFQATLMFVTVGFGLYVLRKITSNLRSFVILGLIWILVYFFADPALIGPQPYPSSSAVRFGPSLIFASFLLLALFSKLKETKPLIYKIGLPLIAAVSFCWSAESSIYSLAIFGAYLLGNILYADEKNLFENLVKPILFVAAGVFSVLAVICVVVYSRVGHMPDFGMFFMYSRGYAEGFGSYGLEFASPVWLLVLVVSLLSVSWVVGTKTERNRTFIRMTIVLVGATGAWFSYFVGRAVPDNVIAMLPLIVFPLLVVTAFASPLSTTSELTVAGEKVSKSTFLWWLSIIAVLLTVSTLVLTNPIVKILTPGWLPAFQSSVKPLPWTDEALAPPALVEALNSIPAEYADLPIAYEGYHGVLLKTEGVLEWTPNTSQVWIPTPLGLLEEPITSAKQEQILSRFMASSPRDGLFIWDIKNSFPDRSERWKQLIQATHTCQQVYLSEDYEILQCAVTK